VSEYAEWDDVQYRDYGTWLKAVVMAVEPERVKIRISLGHTTTTKWVKYDKVRRRLQDAPGDATRAVVEDDPQNLD
jgi:hypothetical protein